jgi:hypothetical protein
MDADDISGAIAVLGCEHACDSDCIARVLRLRFEGEAHAVAEAMASAPPSALSGLVQRHDELLRKAANVTDRIAGMDMCPITLDVIETRAVVPCCNTSFELRALVNSLSTKSSCPMCRAPMDTDRMVVQTDRAAKRARRVVMTKRGVLRAELEKRLEDGASRVVVFSGWDFETVRGVCEELGVRYVVLKGHTSTLHRHIDAFRCGDVRVLLLDANSFGAGLNLECATHAITYHRMGDEQMRQVIGRTQRPGRSSALSLLHLRYDDEDVGASGTP